MIGDGSGVLFKIIDDDQVVVAAYSMYTRTIVPLYPDPMGVVVSGDMQIFTLITEQGVALLSSKSVLQPGIGQEQALSGAEVWKLPDAFSVTVNPREEWLQMYEEAMRNMRDAFYDPNLHGVDWKSVTDRYRPLVYKISSKSELRDILSQAFGELSALHVFVQVKAEDPVLPLGTPSACLGADFKTVSAGLKISYIHDSSGILDAPNSALSQTTSSSHVHLLPGDVITKIDGVLVNSTSLPLSQLLRGKAGMQVLLEVVKAPRSPEERRDEEDLQKLKELRQMQQMMSGGFGMSKASLDGECERPSDAVETILDRHVAKLVRKHSKKISPSTATTTTTTPSVRSTRRLSISAWRLEPWAPGLAKAMLKDLKPEKEDDGINRRHPVDSEGVRDAPSRRRRRSETRIRQEQNRRQGCVRLFRRHGANGKRLEQSFDDFAAQFYPNVRKSGLIIDVRKNAGGNIDTWLLERLRRVAWMFDTERSGPGDTTMQYTFRGKVVVLIDEQTSSDAEMFALGIQQLGIGPVIGERTWGGAIGYSGHPELRLVDGSGFTIPSYGPYLKDDWAIEQKGVTPDVRVSNLPVSTFRGSDAQLDAGINRVLHMIENAEQTEFDLPTAPKYPNRAFDSASCAAQIHSQAKGLPRLDHHYTIIKTRAYTHTHRIPTIVILVEPRTRAPRRPCVAFLCRRPPLFDTVSRHGVSRRDRPLPPRLHPRRRHRRRVRRHGHDPQRSRRRPDRHRRRSHRARRARRVRQADDAGDELSHPAHRNHGDAPERTRGEFRRGTGHGARGALARPRRRRTGRAQRHGLVATRARDGLRRFDRFSGIWEGVER